MGLSYYFRACLDAKKKCWNLKEGRKIEVASEKEVMEVSYFKHFKCLLSLPKSGKKRKRNKIYFLGEEKEEKDEN